jgi:hypothetical protein
MKEWPDVPAYAAFLAGIVPEQSLSWIGDRLKDLAPASVKDRYEGLFKQRDLERRVRGMTFWQAERLAEEGIESVEDLATQDLTGLLMYTRFNTSTLLYWVDQALLLNQIPEADADIYRSAYIKAASDLFDIHRPGRERSLAQIRDSISNALKDDPAAAISMDRLKNLIKTLKDGPNLKFMREYWKTAHDPNRLRTQKARLVSLRARQIK